MSVAGDNKFENNFDNRSTGHDSDYFAFSATYTPEEILSNLENFSNSYSDSGALDVLTKRIPKSIDDVHVLADVKSTDKLEDIGHKLYLNIGDLLRAVDKQIFPPIVASNFDLSYCIKSCRDLRLTVQTAHDKAQELADETLLAPDTKIYDIRAFNDIYEMSEHLRTVYNLQSPEERTRSLPLEVQLQHKKDQIQARHNQDFIREYDIYKAQLEQKNKATITLREKKQELKRLTTQEAVLEAIMAADRQIVTKIQTAILAKCAPLRGILQGMARLPLTKEEIQNPWDSQNLAGIACIIHDRFHKRSFVTFNNYLLEAMNFSLSEADTINAPMKAVAKVQQWYFNWESHNLWEQMTPDSFWTAVLLRSLHPQAPIRHDLLQETQKFIRKLYDDDSAAHSTTPGRMPIFNFAVSHLQTAQDSKKFNSNNYKQQHQSHQSEPHFRPPHQPRSGTLEHAAAATTTAAAVTTPILSTRTPPPSPSPSGPHSSSTSAASSPAGNPYHSDGKTIYTRTMKALTAPVTRAANIYFEHNKSNNKRPYLAVAKLPDLCSKCFLADPHATPPNPCTPACTPRQCTRCSYYGHNAAWCLQTHTTSGVPVN